MAKCLISFGAQREGRTPTLLREPDFESGASASSAIRAYPHSLYQVDLFLTCRRPRVNRQLSPLLHFYGRKQVTDRALTQYSDALLTSCSRLSKHILQDSQILVWSSV